MKVIRLYYSPGGTNISYNNPGENMDDKLIGTGVSFKKADSQMVSDIRDLQETGSVIMSIIREQDMLERVKDETGECSCSLANLL